MGVGNKRTITKTRRKTRDVDQIKADLLSASHLKQHKDTKASEDLPDLGLNYCIECAKWFDSASTLASHRRAKPHKRRLKQLREEPEPNPHKLPGGGASASANMTSSGDRNGTGDDVAMAS